MIHRVVAQLLLAFSVINVIPVDAANLEWQAGLPVPEDALGSPLFTMVSRQSLPVAGARVLPPKKTALDSYGIATSGRSVVVIDEASGATLFEKDPDEARPIGSITKLMTALVFLDVAPNLQQYVAITGEDYVGGGRVYLNFDDRVKLYDVLAASMVGSDNTATKALQTFSGVTVEEFVVKMNEKAAELGMEQTSFADVSGIGNENVSTARELSLLLGAAKKHVVLQDLMTTPSYTVQQASGYVVSISSTDELLGSFVNQDPYQILGGKTGYIPEAGYCFVTSIEKGGDSIFIAVLGAESKLDRFTDAKGLAVWSFKTFTWPDEL